DYPNYRLALAEVYQNQGNLDKAKEMYLTEKNNPFAMAAVGWIELKKGNLKEAKKIFQKNPVAESFLGLAELSSAQKLAYLKKALELEKTPRTLRAMAVYYLNHKKYHLAEKYVAQLPGDKYLQALLLKGLNQKQKAIEILKELSIENAFNWGVWLELATLAESINDATVAENAYRRVLDLKKDSLAAAQGLARLLMKQSRLSEAMDIYQKLVRENPQDKETLLAVATILEGLGETLEALGLYFNLLTLGQKGLSKTLERLILKLSQTDKETALRFSEGWCKHFPQNKTAQKLLTTLKVLLVFLCLYWGTSFAQIPLPDKDLDLLWQSKMAGYGDADGQYQLAQIYEKGRGVPRDLAKAIYYYQLSAYQEYLPSALELGRLFANEKAVQDEKKSIEWYTFAATRGEIQAENYLFHYYDELPTPDKKQAFYWLEKMLKTIFPGEENLARVSADYERLQQEITQ
ncbi:MAG: tetratricopeptide repeat protein, partial [Alphaproteobacteria bacterium]